MPFDRREFLAAGCFMVRPPAGSAETAGRHTLEAGEATLSLVAPKGRAARLLSLQNRETGFEWVRPNLAFEPIFVSGSRPQTASLSTWLTESASRSIPGHTLHLTSSSGAEFHARTACACFPDVPVFEFRTEFQNKSAAPLERVTAFGPVRIPLRPDLGPLEVHCMRRNSYALERLPVQGKLTVEGGGWNAPSHAGLLILEAMKSHEFLFVGIEWERGWRYTLEVSNDAVWLAVDVSGLSHDLAPDVVLSTPRVFLGLAGGDLDRAVNAAHLYLKTHVFPNPLPNSPWVAYDIWGTENEGVEQALLDEIDFAADLGVELFYVDASWYKGSSRRGTGDWGCGLGNYEEDRHKYPRGLAYMSERVHSRGMNFGLWVGPNIVDSRLVPNTIPHRWVAQLDGADRVLEIPAWEATCHQVCLGCPEYIEHLKRNLSRLVLDFRLDWLKWDNSGLPGLPAHCNRPDHGHQAGDGSYAALAGQYQVFEHLHEAFPNLVLEQCGYGSRHDYGLARTIRANWLSDASFPATHVRENALVAAFSYPSFYNGGWVVREDPELEKVKDAARLDTLFRSRMLGLFGFGTLTGKLSERVSLFAPEVLTAARRNIPLYKRYRHLLRERIHYLFPPSGSPESWQAVEFHAGDASEAVVLCFRGKSTQASLRLILRGLNPTISYSVTSANTGQTSRIGGAKLLQEGIIATLQKPETSEVFLIRAV